MSHMFDCNVILSAQALQVHCCLCRYRQICLHVLCMDRMCRGRMLLVLTTNSLREQGHGMTVVSYEIVWVTGLLCQSGLLCRTIDTDTPVVLLGMAVQGLHAERHGLQIGWQCEALVVLHRHGPLAQYRCWQGLPLLIHVVGLST